MLGWKTRASWRAGSLATFLVVIGAACGTSVQESTEYRGVLLEPGGRPEFRLADVNGEPYSFRKETEDQLALLFFGYTHCPDICPVHMAGIAAVLRDLPWAVRDRIRVVFVSTDPERDTPERLQEWLGGFDPSFIGLRGEMDEVNRIQAELGLPTTVRTEDPADGGAAYEVGHAAQVLVFGADGVRLAYPFGTRQADWKRDLPQLVSRLPPVDGEGEAGARRPAPNPNRGCSPKPA